MKRRQRVAHVVVLGAIAVPAFFATPAAAATPAGALADQATQQAVVELLDRLPLLFVPEDVSRDGAAVFVVRTWGGSDKIERHHPAARARLRFDLSSRVEPRQPVG